MTVGNWRSHIIVKCKICKKPMGYHIATKEATCVECDMKHKGDHNVRNKNGIR